MTIPKVNDLNKHIIVMVATFMAGCIVMILHELPKSIYLYYVIKKDKNMIRSRNNKIKNIFKVWEYMDPLGLMFCIMFKAGFSRNRMFVNRRKAGVIGFISLFIQFVVSAFILKYVFLMDENFMIVSNGSYMYVALAYFCTYTAVISLGMFITNFFPVSFFNSYIFTSGVKELSDNNLNYVVSDMSTAVNISETKSSTNYLTVPKAMPKGRKQNEQRYQDYRYFIILLILYFLRIIPEFSYRVLMLFLRT